MAFTNAHDARGNVQASAGAAGSRAELPGKRTLTESAGHGGEAATAPGRQPGGGATSHDTARGGAQRGGAGPLPHLDLGARSSGATGIQRRAEQVATRAAAPAPSASGPGAPLEAGVRATMEASFAADFGSVRVHEGETATAMGAVAYAQGEDLHFAPGAYDPGSAAGRELIGHELAHVVQQRQGRAGSGAQAKGGGIQDDPSLEREADQLGGLAARGEPAHGGSTAPAAGSVGGVIQCRRVYLQNGKGVDTETVTLPELEQWCQLAESIGDYDALLELILAVETGDYQGGRNPSPELSFEERRWKCMQLRERVQQWKLAQAMQTMQPMQPGHSMQHHGIQSEPTQTGHMQMGSSQTVSMQVEPNPTDQTPSHGTLGPSTQSGSRLERILGGQAGITMQDRTAKRFENMSEDEEQRHRGCVATYRDQMLCLYRLDNLTPNKLNVFRDLPVQILKLVCDAQILEPFFALSIEKINSVTAFGGEQLAFMLETRLLMPLCGSVSAEILTCLRRLSVDSFKLLGMHLCSSFEQLTTLRRQRFEVLCGLPAERFVAVMKLSGGEIAELFGMVSDEHHLARLVQMKPTVFVRFLSLGSSCRVAFLNLANDVVKQFFGNPVERQEALMTDAEIGAMSDIAMQEVPYAPTGGTNPNHGTGIHMPHSLGDHGAHISDAEMDQLATLSPAGKKGRWASAEVQQQCMEWALTNYKKLQYIGQQGCYVGTGLDITTISSHPSSGVVFEGHHATPTRKFSVTIYLDGDRQPHVYTAYPVP